MEASGIKQVVLGDKLCSLGRVGACKGGATSRRESPPPSRRALGTAPEILTAAPHIPLLLQRDQGSAVASCLDDSSLGSLSLWGDAKREALRQALNYYSPKPSHSLKAWQHSRRLYVPRPYRHRSPQWKLQTVYYRRLP
ncbi:hypothetical protein NDU88_007022 [Pleurodeles waltl]|uniref:Uncharacterized protein n=1 Tax=Pleurodeles waltl TaxID=8319 RepID=A0AAV7VT42_PLEWA|nr:hypothetical protein NDU88_007022 [Pleurodeles waltl]